MFTVLTDSRCGSHMLQSLLNSHPALNCYDEILGNCKDDKNFWELGEREGFLLSYGNLIGGGRWAKHGYDIPKVIDKITRHPIIHLERGLEERAKSQLVHGRVARRKRIFRRANLFEPIDIDPKYENFNGEEIKRECDIFEERQRKGMEAMHEHAYSGPLASRWLHVRYEWLCGNQELKELSHYKSRVFCSYLEVPVTKLTCSLYKIRKYKKSN